MIEQSSPASSGSVRNQPGRPSPPSRTPDQEAAKRFGELVQREPKGKGSQAENQRPLRRPADHARDSESSVNPFAPPAGIDAVAGRAQHDDHRPGPHGDAASPEIALDQTQTRPQSGAAAVDGGRQSAPAPAAEAAFTAMLDRVHLQQTGTGNQTVLSMTDTRWLAHEAVVTQSNAGGLSLSMSMNNRDGSNEALEELHRRLEARGLTVDSVTALQDD